MSCTVALIQGLRPNSHRGLAFLECEGDDHVNAKKTFDGLSEKPRHDLFNRFQHWQDGGIKPDYHHGWNDKDYKCCYVFKWRRGSVRYRMYGFLIHAKPETSPGFEACILVSYTQKTEHQSDPVHKNKLNTLRVKPEIVRAIREKFVNDKSSGKEHSNDGKRKALDRRK